MESLSLSISSDSPRDNSRVSLIKSLAKLSSQEFFFPKLMMRLCFWRATKGDNKYKSWIVAAGLWMNFFVMCGVYVSRLYDFRSLDWSGMGHLFFNLHGCAVYTIIAYLMHDDMKLLKAMRCVLEPTVSITTRPSVIEPISEGRIRFEKITTICALIILVMATGNVVGVYFIYGNPLAEVFHIQRSVFLGVIAYVMWSILSFCWFMPVLFVFPTMNLFVQHGQAFIQYIIDHKAEDINIFDMMEWYDDLYGINLVLQNYLGLLVTASISIGSAFQIVILMVGHTQ